MRFPFAGIVLDVDGVTTDTRRIHFRAWKRIFDQELGLRNLTEFTDEDYQNYVDGRPREEGILSLFKSRGLSLELAKVREVAEAKNEIFLTLLREHPPKAYDDFFKAMKLWKSQAIDVMAVSSSKNCRPVLESAGVIDMFKLIIDGTDALALELNGKPAPDYFLEAIKRARLRPRDCAIVEDSLSGIIAGRRGDFSYVFGMSRVGQTSPQELYLYGADYVVSSLEDIGKMKNPLTEWADFKARVGGRDVALFVDYDGTLTDIVNDPRDAHIPESTRAILKTCSKSFKVSIISGRDRNDVKQRVGIDSIFYSGCHGLDVSGPGCFHFEVEEVSGLLSELEEASLVLSAFFAPVEGIVIERKRFSTALHYRMVSVLSDEKIVEEVSKLLARFENLRCKLGKKVIEIIPDVEWDKSKAVDKISEILEIDPRVTVPIYIGDDVTDEDVFISYRRKGICIKVCEDECLLSAHYKLRSPAEVGKFLTFLAQEYAGEEKRWKPGL